MIVSLLGSKGGLLVAVLAVAASAAGLVALDPFGGEEPSPFEVPELEPGVQAMYSASGNYTNAFRDPLVGERDDVPPNSTLYVNATPMQVPNASGRPTDALIVSVAQPSDPMIRTVQADGRPLAEVTPDAVPHGGFGHEPFGNLTKVKYRVGPEPADSQLDGPPALGFADVALLGGLSIPEEGTTVAEASPLGQALVESHPPYADGRIEPVEREDGFELQITSGDDNLQGAYVFEGDCPFPAQIRIPAHPSGTEFAANRTSCETTDPEPGEGEGWPTPSTSTIERRFPGEGEALPLHYREAFEFFLTLPETQAYTDENPDWVLYCAKLLDRGSPEPLYSNWTWWFKLSGESGIKTGWVTRTQALQGPDGPWVRDPSPPEELLYPCLEGPEDPLRGAAFANLDDSLEILDTLLAPTLGGDEVHLGQVTLSPFGTGFFLDRCGPWLESKGGGICGETVPKLQLARDGRVMFTDLEPQWFGPPLAPIAGP